MQRTLILLSLMGQCCIINCHLYEYHYIKEEKNWTEAQQFCRKNHTDLATVTNIKDVKRIFNITASYHRNVWIGLFSKPEFNRTWYWSLPGVEFNENETKWNKEEPNNGQQERVENCGILKTNLQWADTACDEILFSLCYSETNTTHKYHLIKEKKTWQKAQSYCREKHTDLISGLKQLQDEELKIVMNSAGNESVYIGLFRDTWRWSDGSSFSFRHWHNYHNNLESNSHQCASAGFGDEGRWNTDSCEEIKPFICYDDKVILIKKKMKWEDALNYCRENYHDLVNITNLNEQRWVQEKAKNASTDYVWIGLHYDGTLDFWSWVNAKVACYTMNCSDERMDDCDISGAMEKGGGHQWMKKRDSKEFNFLCYKR